MDALKRWSERLALWAPPKGSGSAPKDPGDGWVKMAEWFERRAGRVEEGNGPLLSRLEEMVDTSRIVLDVGAGWGRVAIPLAARVRKVLAVESSSAMRSTLQKRIAARGVQNVEVLAGRWPGVEVPQVDVAISANVVYDVADLGPFIQKMNLVAARGCFVELTPRHPLDAFRGLWQEFVGWMPPEGPTYLDAAECLREVGIEPQIEVVRAKPRLVFQNLDEATEFCRDRLGLVEGSEAEEALRERVAQRGSVMNGYWVPDWQFEEAVILSWSRV